MDALEDVKKVDGWKGGGHGEDVQSSAEATTALVSR